MIKEEQSPPKLISIPKGGQYHTYIVPEKEPWYIVLAANIIAFGSLSVFMGYVVWVALTV